MPLYDRAEAWPRRPADLPRVELLDRVLLGDPAHFAIEQALNVHMTDGAGRLKQADAAAARRQWQALAAAYRAAGTGVAVLAAPPGLPDFCFTANPSFVLPLPGGGREMWLSRMAHPSRAGEVAAHEEFGRSQGLRLRRMPPAVPRFEGCGDAILHPGRFLLHGGVGPRSDRSAWQELCSAHPDLDVLAYRLVDPRFYHLDTALAPLDERAALVVPQAFEPAGLELLGRAFPDLIEVPLDEALRFAANAHCPDGRHVLLQSGCPRTEAELRRRGFAVMPLETGEFIKSGGSVFCLKLAY